MITIYYADFSDLRDAELAEPETAYRIRNIDGSFSYGYTDDGIGFFFYNTLAELTAEH